MAGIAKRRTLPKRSLSVTAQNTTVSGGRYGRLGLHSPRPSWSPQEWVTGGATEQATKGMGITAAATILMNSTSGEVRARLELPPWALRSFLLKAVKDLNHIVRSGQLSYGRTPILRRKVIIGHQLVNADWTRFNATKPVNQNHFGLT